MREITVTVGGRWFRAELLDGDAAETLAGMLPLTLHMRELNGNEKYGDLGRSLPTSPEAVGTIHAGDLMLYGDDCLVIFYKTFRTGYRYTRIGRVTDPDGLAEALGNGDPTVTFS